MAVKRLDPGTTSRCSPGVATLAWSVSGAPSSDVVLQVLQRDDPRQPALAVRRTGVDNLLLAALPAAAVVEVHPAAGGVFPDGLTISGELTMRDGDQYVLAEADVSGTASATLLTLTPDDETGAWELAMPPEVVVRDPRAPKRTRQGTLAEQAVDGPGPVATGLDAPDDDGQQPEAGGELAQRTAYAVRRRAGLARLAVEDRTELVVAVDRSASLLPHVRTGAGQAVLEVLLGLNAVCGRSEEVPVWEISPVPQPARRAVSARTVADYWPQVLGDRSSTGGTLIAPLVRETAAATGARTVVVLTDAVPADLPEVAAELRRAREQGAPVRWHLLVLGRGPDDPDVRRDPWRDELAALRPLQSEGLLTASAISPGRGPDWLSRRLADRAALEQLVRSLPLTTQPPTREG